MIDSVVEWVVAACVFLLVAGAIEHYVRRTRVPAVGVMLVLGMLYGFVAARPGMPLPSAELPPEIVFYVLIPMLIFGASRALRLRALRQVGVEASLLATVGVLVSAGLVGLTYGWWTGMGIADGLLFGAIVAATDPTAITAVLGRSGLPERLRTLIAGESLLNDGTAVAIVAYLAPAVVAGEPIPFTETASGFLLAVGGAALLGVAGGLACGGLLRSWRELQDHFVGALIPLVFVYLLFAVAESLLHVSGVIAVLAASQAMHRVRRHAEDDCEPGRDTFHGEFYGFLSTLVDAVLYFVVGAAIGAHDFAGQWQIAPALIGLVLLARAVAVYGLLAVPWSERVPWAWRHVLNLAGLKGAVSVALVLLLPLGYEHRYAMRCGVLVLVVFTTLVNSQLLHSYVRRSSLGETA